MQVLILNRHQVRERVSSPREALISITSPYLPFQVIEFNDYSSCLFIRFEDTEVSPGLITPIEAGLIANFFLSLPETIDTIVVNCDAGISRSAGVGAAILEFLRGEGDTILKDVRYFPNKLVYNSILQALKENEKKRYREEPLTSS